MKLDPHLIEIDRTADDREPTEVYVDQMAVIMDNLICGYWIRSALTPCCVVMVWRRPQTG